MGVGGAVAVVVTEGGTRRWRRISSGCRVQMEQSGVDFHRQKHMYVHGPLVVGRPPVEPDLRRPFPLPLV